MPCNSDYMEPTNREKRLQETAQLLRYVYKQIHKPINDILDNASNDIYCKIDFVPTLCEEIKKLSKEELANIVYNAYNKDSRRLADWWEEHLEADRQREEDELDKKRKEGLKKRALSKLTAEEIEALELE